jgi:DNA end-binding protein Ku
VFVDAGEVDLALVEKSYWVGPAGKTCRSYELLRTALERSGKVAIARVKIRTRTRLALLRPREGRFSLDMMRFGDELVPANDVDVPSPRTKRTAKEMDLAMDLIKQMAGHFDPEKHPDDYRSAVLKAVEHKEVTEELAEDVEAAAPGKVVDLAAMLSRSLAGVGKRAANTNKKAPKRKGPSKTKGRPTRATRKAGSRKAARRV